MNKYAYYWEDEIMAEHRQRVAELRERYGSDEAYNKHLDEDRPRLEAEGWHFVTPEEHAARLARRALTSPAGFVCGEGREAENEAGDAL